MTQSSNLIKNTLIYTVGNLGSKVLTFALLPVLSFYLTKKDLGEYDVLLTTISMFVPFVSLQISDATYKWLLNVNDESEESVITNGLILLLVTTGIFTVIYLGVGMFYSLSHKYYFIMMLIVSMFLPFLQQTIRGIKKNKLYAVAGLVNAGLILVLNILFLVVFHLGLNALFLALILSNAITFLILAYFSGIYKYINFKSYNNVLIKRMLKYCIPLVPNNISWWLVNAADKFIIAYYLGVSANGIYAISTRFPTIITILNSVFMLAWQDHSMTTKESNIDSKTFVRFYTFELSFVLILIAGSRLIVEHLVNKNFVEAYKYMPLLFIGAAYSAFAGYFGPYYLKSGNTRGIFVTSIVGAVTNIAIVFLLIHKIGLYSSALGTVVSFLLIFLYRYFDLRKEISINVNFLKLTFLTALCVVFSLLMLAKIRYIDYMLLAAAVVIFCIFNAEMMKKVKRMIIK